MKLVACRSCVLTETTAPGAAAILSRIGIGDYVEFGDHVDGGMSGLGAQFLHVLGKCVVVDAVEDEIVLQRVDAVDVEVADAAGRGRAALICVTVDLHARHVRSRSSQLRRNRGVSAMVSFEDWC